VQPLGHGHEGAQAGEIEVDPDAVTVSPASGSALDAQPVRGHRGVMNIFVCGGSGYLGRALLARLGDHSVTALARSDAAASVVSSLGARVVRASLADLDALRQAASEADVTINLAQDNAGDTAVLAAEAADALAGAAPTYLHTGGTWAYGNAASDDAPLAPPPSVEWFAAIVSRVRAAGAVVLMPGVVYGHGGGILEPLMGARYIGEGTNRMALVHVDDVADLYVRALAAPAGSMYIAAGPDAPAMREVAAWFGDPVSVTADEFGPFAEVFALDQRFESARAREELGWEPRGLAVQA
jgi:nucleoside-diphosphate-sugar epimerase